MRKVEQAIPTSYATAEALLGDRETLDLGGNTRLVRLHRTGISLVLYATEIVLWRPDGRIILYTGDHRTVTTKSRINAALRDSEFRVRAVDGTWRVASKTNSVLLSEGHTLNPTVTLRERE